MSYSQASLLQATSRVHVSIVLVRASLSFTDVTGLIATHKPSLEH